MPGTYLLPEIVRRVRRAATRASSSTSTCRPRPGALDARSRPPRRARRSSAGSRSPAELDSRAAARRRGRARRPARRSAGRRLRPQGARAPHRGSPARKGSATRAAVETARWEMGLRTVRDDRAAVVGGGEARSRQGRRHRRRSAGSPLDVGARGRHAGRPRRPEVAAHPDDRPRARRGRPAHAAGRALRRATARAARARPSRRRRPTRTCPRRPHRSSDASSELAEVVELLRDGARLVTFTGAGRQRQDATRGRDRPPRSWTTSKTASTSSSSRRFATPTSCRTAIARRPARRSRTSSASGSRDARMLLVLDNFEHLRRGGADRVPRCSEDGAGLQRARRRAAGRSASRASANTGSSRSSPTPPPSSSSHAPATSTHGSATARRSAGSASGSTGCRWRWSSPPPGRAERRLPAWPRCSSASCPCCPAGATRRRGSGRSRPRSPGATTCLSDDQQELLARLAVFRGGCSPEAAEDVCERGRRRPDRARRAQASSASATDGRLALLETVREFAAERLGRRTKRFDAATPSTTSRSREHARWFARGPREKEWIDRLNVELDNFRAALAIWRSRAGDAALGPDARRGAGAALDPGDAPARGPPLARAAARHWKP